MPNNIVREIELLQQMIKFNQELVTSFEDSERKQRNTINQMRQEGISKTHVSKLEDHLRENKVKLNQLKSSINNNQIPRIKSIIRDLDRHR